MEKKHQAVLMLGSNQGERHQFLERAIEHITCEIGEIEQKSKIYQTEPFGFQSENLFLNQALVVTTQLAPMELLDITQNIEWNMGRRRESKERYEDRLIDIDIQFYDQQVISTKRLTIPHPELANRSFVLEPLMEIIPDWHHPQSGKSVKEMWEVLKKRLY